MKIVIASVGSLVGQNILDALEGRRTGIEVVGLNSTAEAAGNFRCDRAYLAPPAARGDDYLERLSEVLLAERPDLALPGRDDDVLALARLKEREPALRTALPVGPLALAEVFDDKWASHDFATQRALPYVASAPVDDDNAIERLIAEYGYPLLAKPRAGNGSRGVRIVFDAGQCAAVRRLDGYLLQPYLQAEQQLPDWNDFGSVGIPLFHAPMLQQIACQGIIGADGMLRGLICTTVDLVMGRTERSVRLDDPDVQRIAVRYAEAFVASGWVGAFNLQGRRDRDGRFCVYELNGRLTGATTARQLIGFDEVGMLVEGFVGQTLATPRIAGRHTIVTKSLAEFVTAPADIERLRSEGCWRAG